LLTFNQFPMSPSANAIYKIVKNRKVSSKKLKDFEGRCQMWSFTNRNEIVAARKIMRDEKKRNLFAFKYEFCFHFKSVFCIGKDNYGDPKKMDVSNRIKAAEDNICRLLAIDDKQIMKIQAEKIIIVDEMPEHINISIESYEYDRGKYGKK